MKTTRPRKYVHRQRGMVLIVALLLMAVMSIIGATAITSSRVDLNISANTKIHRQAFYFADGGIEMSPKIVREAIDQGAMPATPNTVYDAGVFSEIMGYATEADAADNVYTRPTGVNPDVTMTHLMTTFVDGSGDTINELQRVDMDIDRSGTSMAAGSGVEFAAGAEGAGVGAAGGVLIFYTIEAVGDYRYDNQTQGTTQVVSSSYLDVYYRYVPGIAGGK
ncbi:MAG: PilX N-terminal domain-containing pilus assembly protein [Thermodesulfobacteriota bacterium]